MTRFENSASNVLSIIGILCFLLAGFIAVRNTWKLFTYEGHEAVITGFHQHKNGRSHPNIAFFYQDDSVKKRLDFTVSNSRAGKSYHIIFPEGQPDKLEFRADLWVPVYIAAFFGGLFLIPYVFFRNKKNLSSFESSGRYMSTLAAFAFVVPFLYTFSNLLLGRVAVSFYALSMCLMIGVFTVIICGISFYFWKHHLIRKHAEKWLGKNGMEIDAALTGIRTSTTFNRARDGVIYSTELNYYLFCRWTRPSDKKTFHFRSLPFAGEFPYYSNSHIKVTIDPEDPAKRYSVNLDFLSAESGIALNYSDCDQPPPVKITDPFMDEAGTFLATSAGIGFTALVLFLMVQRVYDPTYDTEWIGLFVGLLLGLLFLRGAFVMRQSKYILKKGTVIEARYTGTEKVATERKRNTVYGVFSLSCEWIDPATGTARQFISETFRGESLYYNNEKIIVHLSPSKRAYIVDLDFVSSLEKTGIPLESTFPIPGS